MKRETEIVAGSIYVNRYVSWCPKGAAPGLRHECRADGLHTAFWGVRWIALYVSFFFAAFWQTKRQFTSYITRYHLPQFAARPLLSHRTAQRCSSSGKPQNTPIASLIQSKPTIATLNFHAIEHNFSRPNPKPPFTSHPASRLAHQ
jgi:hypothetical protein